MNDATWFNKHLESKINEFIEGQISINQFRTFIYPNACYLELPEDHKIYQIKELLDNSSTKTIKENLKKVVYT